MNNLSKLLGIFYKTKLKEFQLVLMALGLLTIITLLGFLNDHLNTTHRSELYSLQHANQELSYAHIWLDELVNSERNSINTSNPKKINILKAKQYVQTLLKFKETVSVFDLFDIKQRSELTGILNHLNRLEKSANICVNTYLETGHIPDIYNNHEEEFNGLKQSLNTIHNALILRLNNELKFVRISQYTLLFILFIHIILTVMVINNFRRQLIEREHHLKEAQRIAMLGFYTYNFITKQWYVSESILDLIGKDKSNSPLKTWLKIIHHKDKQKVISEFSKTNTALDLTYRVLRSSDHKVRWIHHISKDPEKDQKSHLKSMLGTIQDITEKRKLERDFIHAFIDAQEQEKQSFGEDLHDGISQILAAESMYIDVLLRINKSEDKRVSESLVKIKELNLNAINDARGIAHGLMSKQLKESGLIVTIEHICEDFNQSKKVEFIFESKNLKENEISKEIKINIFRIAQEIATNIVRHSGAKKVDVSLTKTKQNQLQLIIKDDGVGIDFDKIKSENKGAGLKNIERRVTLLNGKLSLKTELQKGTCYTIIVPLESF